jgi:hypothetical protein
MISIAALAVMALAWVTATSGQIQSPGSTGSRITIAASVVDVRETRDVRSDVLLLWNRNIRSRPLGHAIVSCYSLGFGGILGAGLEHCTATYVLPLGKITAQGIVHSRNRYTLVLTGGTGRYVGAEGHLFTKRIGPGLKRIVFNL